MPNPKVATVLSDSDIIDRFGGTSALARLLEIEPPSVSEWRKRGIPKARRQTLRLLRPELFQEPAPAVPAEEASDAG